jgi:CDP-glucose 4,6-dehydratase
MVGRESAVDQLNSLASTYRGKRVFLTGHTGFKGSWLSLWLSALGAEVHGYALQAPTDPSMFELCGVSETLHHVIGDIRDESLLQKAIQAAAPDFVFHLAAQPIVRRSYTDPIYTVDVNIGGTARVLEAIRALDRQCAVVVVTSDKCYANNEWAWGYRENDPMGGSDPYSMSKGAAELVASCWRASYFSKPNSKVRLASARAGNVIGGGDWAEDRILTDCVAAFRRGAEVELRNPIATRPWQHVLEPLSGYLWLGAKLASDDGARFADGWNFGPSSDSVQSVSHLVSLCASRWGSGGWRMSREADPPKESMSLGLCIDKAQQQLKWRPVWDLVRCVAATVDWYKAWNEGSADLREISRGQIRMYQSDAAALGLKWALPVT